MEIPVLDGHERSGRPDKELTEDLYEDFQDLPASKAARTSSATLARNGF